MDVKTVLQRLELVLDNQSKINQAISDLQANTTSDNQLKGKVDVIEALYGLNTNALNITVDELVLTQQSNIYQNSTGNYGWRDLQSPFTVRTSNSQNNPSWIVLFNGMQGLAFSKSTMNQVWVDFHIDHDYAMGTNLYPHVHWCPTTVDGGVVRWGIEYTVAKGHQQQAFPATTTVYIEQTIQPNSQWMHFVGETSDLDAISSVDVEPDTVIKVRFFRDAAHPNDTYDAVVHAWQGDIHYQTGRLSSLNKAPNFFG
jgi:hypothetical protein